MFQKILETCIDGIEHGKCFVLATVVLAKGSTYRGIGARMLIDEDYNTIGEVGGGCFNDNLLIHVKDVFNHKQTILQVYAFGYEASEPVNAFIGCNVKSLTKILLEYLYIDRIDWLKQLLQLVVERKQFYMIHLLDGIDDDLVPIGNIGVMVNEVFRPSDLNNQIGWNEYINELNLSTQSLKNGYLYAELPIQYAARTILLESIEPVPELWIAGIGDDIIPIIQFAHILGWNCKVFGEHKEEIFIQSTIIAIDKYEKIIEPGGTESIAMLLIMTHNYAMDKSLLKASMDKSFLYVGLLGPKLKSEKIFNELALEGIVPNDKFMSRFHNPIGLDIGCESSQEVALSIVAELQAVLKNRNGGLLKNSAHSVHDRK